MRNIKFILLILFTFSLSAQAKIKIGKMSFTKSGNQGTLKVYFSGQMKEYPDLSINKTSINIQIPNSIAARSTDKTVSFATSGRDTRVRINQFNKNTTQIKTVFPFEVHNKREKVALTIKENFIELTFPKLKAQRKVITQKRVKAKAVKVKQKIVKEALNEDFLKSLEREIKTKRKEGKKLVRAKKTPLKKDKVKVALSATDKPAKKQAKSSFSFMEYGGKFVAFLGLVLLLFYGVVSLMKKGFIKKGRLGFLNNTGQVQVLSQTYITPKKSLMLIKAHEQVFLVSNTDSGIQLVSEINDTTGLLKEGEKLVAGNNFDDSLSSANSDSQIEEKVQLKQDIVKSNKVSALSSYKEVKEKVKFSDQLKKKVKNLKPLQ